MPLLKPLRGDLPRPPDFADQPGGLRSVWLV